MSNFGSKGQRSTFRRLSGCTYFLTGYLDTSWSVFFLLCTQIQDDDKKMPKKFLDKLSLINVSKCRSPKALEDFADFSVLCQLGLFTYVFCYQLLMIFRCFGIFLLDCTDFFQLYNTRKKSYRAGVQTVQIDLQKFCFIELCSNFAFVLKTSRTTFLRCKKTM